MAKKKTKEKTSDEKIDKAMRKQILKSAENIKPPKLQNKKPRNQETKKTTNVVKICTEMDLDHTPAEQIKAYKIAKEKNPHNIPESNIENVFHLALVRGKLHKVGATLKIKFMNGTAEQKRKARELAIQWETYANIKFQWVTSGNADVRIAFKWNGDRGSWSYIGTDCFNIAQNKPTMNFGWLDAGADQDEWDRVVIHEFGHMLGCIHEHQNPSTNVPWDKPKVYEYYRRTNGWDKETVDSNIFQKYSESRTQFSQFDKHSIMLYAIPDSLTIGTWSVGFNTKLSDMDKSFIATCYPKTIKETNVINIGEMIQADIGEYGEEDYYALELTNDSPRSLRIYTTGKTDVVMSLMDVNKKVIAWDDDSGQDLNSRIEKTLNKGKYLIRIKHYSPNAKGAYGLTVIDKNATLGDMYNGIFNKKYEKVGKDELLVGIPSAD